MILNTTQQEAFWAGDFGREYTDRNSRHLADWNEFYRLTWGRTKSEMNQQFLGELPRNSRILEVGCNTGMQLVGLQGDGFTELYGVELQSYAVEKAKAYSQYINLIQGSALTCLIKTIFSTLSALMEFSFILLLPICPASWPR
jgi:SAM-dependent methyltransferase